MLMCCHYTPWIRWNQKCLQGGGIFGTCLFDTSVPPNVLTFQDYNRLRLFFLRNSQETVAWVFFHDTVFWKINWVTFRVLFYFSEKVDCLWLAATKCYFGAVQVISDTFRVCVLVSHMILYLH